MEQQELIQKLQEKTQSDPVYKDVLSMWAERQRARSIVTVHALQTRMEARGIHYTDKQYGSLLKDLSSMGLGRLQVKPGTHQVRALSEIKLTLQSVGAAGLGKTLQFEAFKNKNRYRKIKERVEQLQAVASETRDFPVSLTVMINGKPVNFRVPKELSVSEIAELVHKFRG